MIRILIQDGLRRHLSIPGLSAAAGLMLLLCVRVRKLGHSQSSLNSGHHHRGTVQHSPL